MDWLKRLEARLRAQGELPQRLTTGMALAAVALAAVLIGGVAFQSLVIVFALLMILEWRALTQGDPPLIAGLVHIGLPVVCLLSLPRLAMPEYSDAQTTYFTRPGSWPVLHLIAMVAATDIGAYVAGRSFGKHKLAPAISPGKTWEGLGGGVLAAASASMLFALVHWIALGALQAVLIAVAVAVAAQMGDLYESSLKRRAGVKDSGTILPGHGGALDRLDGLLFAAPLYLVLMWLSGGVLLP